MARAVCFDRLCKLHDRTCELRRHRASGLNLVVAAIMLWNSVYLERAVPVQCEQGGILDEALLKHVSSVH
ncbi:Tn3 family transposase [Burkholderia pseudomallei]|uniref:Tn3 family transposase n=1 Tax=Burkholderia pseudomallei TaxID=28450 RepID=UPI0035E3F48E